MTPCQRSPIPSIPYHIAKTQQKDLNNVPSIDLCLALYNHGKFDASFLVITYDLRTPDGMLKISKQPAAGSLMFCAILLGLILLYD